MQKKVDPNEEIRKRGCSFPTKERIDQLRKLYPVGSRVKLVHMDDLFAPPQGTLGTVVGLDDMGSILLKWDNGSTLNVVYGEDVVNKVEE